MSLLSSESAVEELLRRIPAFATERAKDESYISYDDDSPYLVYGDFARFLEQLILNRSRSATEGILAESFALLSELATSPNDEVADLAVVGVFEQLADCPDCIPLTRSMLSKEAAKLFDRVLRGWI
ncbi:MAG TPA: hypothetical protein VHH35_18490 [Pyrinomonadaceae bacterium]|nr:hypothetical protein [Pyrinomonadaceae bacterium]